MIRATRGDEGAMRMKTVVSMLVFFVILGIASLDGFALMSNHVKAESGAQDAAYAASEAYYHSKNLQDAYDAAVAALSDRPEDHVLTQGFTVDPDGTIHLLVQRHVDTLVLKSIGPWKHYTTTVQHGDANYASD